MKMAVATITSKGQLTLPKEVREQLHVEQGDKVEFVIGPAGDVEIRRLAGSARRLTEIVRRPVAPKSLDELDRELGEALAEDDERIKGYGVRGGRSRASDGR
jgi:antitoxin PrlF